MNRYFSARIHRGGLVLGAWAPSLAIDSGAEIIPVWKDFLNGGARWPGAENIAIVAETDESDSEGYWQSRGIRLAAEADSMYRFSAGRYELAVYWFHPKTQNTRLIP
jgi:hypothetical protein